MSEDRRKMSHREAVSTGYTLGRIQVLLDILDLPQGGGPRNIILTETAHYVMRTALIRWRHSIAKGNESEQFLLVPKVDVVDTITTEV